MKMVPLGEIVSIIKGKKPTPASASDQFAKRWIQIEDLRSNRSITFADNRVKGMVNAQPSDVLIAWDGANAGTIGWGLDGIIGSTIAIVRPNNLVHPTYLGYFLRFCNATIRGNTTGATIPHVNGSHLRTLRVPIPSIEEQRRIASILDQADALRAKRRQQLAHLDSLPQALLTEALTSTNASYEPLAKVIDNDDRINYGIVQPGEEHPGGVPVIRVGNLRHGRIMRDELKHVDPKIEASYTRSRLLGNEVLVSCVGSIGEVALVSQCDVGSNIARAVARIPISDNHLRNWVFAFLSSAKAQRFFQEQLRTVAQPTLNIRQLSELQVPIPERRALQAFSVRLSAVTRERNLFAVATAAEHELTQTLSSRAFRGEL